MPRLFAQFRKALLLALDHDMFGVAKAAAYSGMLFSFPAVLVLTTLLAQVPEGSSIVGEVRSSLDQFLPAGSHGPAAIGAGDKPLLLDQGACCRPPVSASLPGWD